MTRVDLKRGWCPSLLRPMESGDGWLVRVRPRAAVITAATARAVAEAAMRYGNGRIEITNRANLQIRGLRPETIAPFAAAMEAVGAGDDGPAVLVSPLVGADPTVAAETLAIAEAVARGPDPRAHRPGRPDARDEPAHDDFKNELPPKFGFLIDGGGALPLTGMALDVTLRATQGRWHLNGAEVPAEEAASRALALAVTVGRSPRRTAPAPALGFYGAGKRGAVLLAPAFGQMQAMQLAALADIAERHGDGSLRPTPWKSLAIAGVLGAEAATLRTQAEAIGLITDAEDSRLGIVTCIGVPGCIRATVHTHEAAGVLAASRAGRDPLLHLSGCPKGCAHPGAAAITLVGEAGRFALIRNGRAGDAPAASGLTLAECAALMQSVPA